MSLTNVYCAPQEADNEIQSFSTPITSNISVLSKDISSRVRDAVSLAFDESIINHVTSKIITALQIEKYIQEIKYWKEHYFREHEKVVELTAQIKQHNVNDNKENEPIHERSNLLSIVASAAAASRKRRRIDNLHKITKSTPQQNVETIKSTLRQAGIWDQPAQESTLAKTELPQATKLRRISISPPEKVESAMLAPIKFNDQERRISTSTPQVKVLSKNNDTINFTNVGTGKNIHVPPESLRMAKFLLEDDRTEQTSIKAKGQVHSKEQAHEKTKSVEKRFSSRESLREHDLEPVMKVQQTNSSKTQTMANPYKKSPTTISNQISVPKSADFPYVEVVRKKSERSLLPAYTCNECQAFANAMMASKDRDGNHFFDPKDVVQECSRHRSRFTPPSTPDGFWEMSFADER